MENNSVSVHSADLETMDVETACKRLHIGRALGYRLCANRTMPGLIVCGTRYRIAVRAIERILDQGWIPSNNDN
jgi:excisionase family DNA binding protein